MKRKLKPIFIDTSRESLEQRLEFYEPQPNPKTMLSTILKVAHRIIQPKKLLGKLIGALGSAISIPTIGEVLSFDPERVLIITIVFIFGYVMSWSPRQIKEMFKFLNDVGSKKEVFKRTN